MAKKPDALEDLAQQETASDQQRQKARADFEAKSKTLSKEVPQRFFQLAREVREAVSRFNTASQPGRRVSWRESAALAGGDPNLNSDFNCTLSREKAHITCVLSSLWRPGFPDDAYIIECFGQLRDESLHIRIDAVVVDGQIQYRLSVNSQRVALPLADLPDRLVLAVVKNNRSEIA